ncbi:serine hydrolase [Streptomyces sp. NPDC059452]|uniref:serine hydrolase n=1 Tax=Streptomyces sp. NPDC059452 TaxID=3346835 RepID=UPI0036852D1A
MVGCQLSLYRRGSIETWVHGEEEYGSGRPVTPRSVFAYGSVTKTLTALSAVQLAADGDLDLDAPAGQWLSPGAAGGHPARTATLRHLLSHTAGLPSDHDDESAGSLGHWTTGFLAATEEAEARAAWPAPGTFSYANTGYALVGRAVENATALPWWQAVRDYLLRPLGTGIGVLPGAAAQAETVHAAPGHRPGTGPAGRRTTRSVVCATDPGSAPAGGLAGSAADLVKAASLLVGEAAGGLVEASAVREMTRPVAGAEPFGLAGAWALGVGHFGPADNRWLGHDGGLDGTTCHLRAHPASGTALALTTNSSTGQDLWEALVEELRTACGVDVGVYRPPLPPGVPAAEFADCTGTYRNGGLTVTVELDEPHLVLRLPGGARATGVPGAGLVFSGPPEVAGPARGRFLRSAETGRIEALQYSGRTLLRMWDEPM